MDDEFFRFQIISPLRQYLLENEVQNISTNNNLTLCYDEYPVIILLLTHADVFAVLRLTRMVALLIFNQWFLVIRTRFSGKKSQRFRSPTKHMYTMYYSALYACLSIQLVVLRAADKY